MRTEPLSYSKGKAIGLYDGEDILLEYDGMNTLQARYTHGSGIELDCI